MQSLLTNPKFAEVVSHFELCCKASRDHSKLAQKSCAEFGEHGPWISGVVKDRFPELLKNELRDLARTVTRESNLAYDARPKYVRLATIRNIGNLIARRDGSGFYGPRG